MPYDTTEDLPLNVCDVLPERAQGIYRAAFNNAWDEYQSPGARRGEESRGEAAHKVAWSAVRRDYEKDERSGRWVPKAYT
jgi:cation transport regulator